LLFGKGTHERTLLETLVDLGRERKWRYLELRGGRKSLPASACPSEKYYGHCLDLSPDVQGLFDRLSSPVRRAVRKAEKSGLTVDASNSRESVLQFYRLHARTRRRHGLPPQPLSFFLNIYEEIIKPDLGFVVVVKGRTAPVAAAVFFHSGPVALYKFGASDERKQELRGNNLAMWEGIKRLVGRNALSLDFGRTALSNGGLRQFKRSWGTEEKVIEYYRFDLSVKEWLGSSQRTSEFHNHFFRRLPLAANRIAGALIYPHLD
jgi:lipid II:glycine glycyltransferase (peptidoglycan interpeptide bridge formation enzyme)